MSEKELKDMIKKFIYSGPVDAAQIKNIFKTSMSRATALIKKLDVNGYFIKSTINNVSSDNIFRSDKNSNFLSRITEVLNIFLVVLYWE